MGRLSTRIKMNTSFFLKFCDCDDISEKMHYIASPAAPARTSTTPFTNLQLSTLFFKIEQCLDQAASPKRSLRTENTILPAERPSGATTTPSRPPKTAPTSRVFSDRCRRSADASAPTRRFPAKHGVSYASHFLLFLLVLLLRLLLLTLNFLQKNFFFTDMPDKYADEVQFLNHVLDFFIIE